MAKNEKRTLTPRLRFPEFRDQRGWEEFSLEHMEDNGWLELGRGDVISATDMASNPGSFPVYSSSVKNDGYMGSYGQFMFDEELISWSVDGGGDFFHRRKHKFSVTNVSGYLRLKTDRLSYRFLASQLQSLHAGHTFDYQLKAHPSVIRKLYRLGVPSPAEQQKIADCLTSLDAVVAAQGRKVEAMKAHKKGLMQQLFPREGETLPRLRFREFRKRPKWAVKNIGTMLEETARPIEMDDETEYSLVTVKRRYGGVVSRECLKGRAIKVKSQFIVKAKDFLISKRQIVHNACGLVPPGLDGSIVSNEYSVLGPKDGCDIEFFNYFSQQPEVSSSFLQSSVGIVIEKMLFKLNTWLKFEFLFPLVDEQQRIADCLSTLDSQIAAEADKLAALKTHKKGLMQQLFPTPEGD